MASRSINNYSLNDNDSNIDLAALDTDSASESGSSLSVSHLSSADDETNSNTAANSNTNNLSHRSNHHRSNNNRVSSSNNYINNAVMLNDESSKSNSLSHIQSSKSTRSRRSAQISLNDHSIISSSGHPSLRHFNNGANSNINHFSNNNNPPSISKFPVATRQSTYNSTISSTNASSYITGGTVSNFPPNRLLSGSGNGNSSGTGNDNETFDYYYGDDYDTKDLGTEELDNDDDTYSYDYIANSNVKLKKGDKLKTSWAMPLQNERQYKDLQIIDEVAKLQNLDFFSQNYVENLENLKISQLGLLIDMVKLTENSFDEFYNIWNEFEAKMKSEIGADQKDITTATGSSGTSANSQVKKDNIISSLSSDLESISPTRMIIKETDPQAVKDAKVNSDAEKSEKIKSKSSIEDAELDVDEKIDTDLVTRFDINNSEGFKLMKKRKQEILKDLEKINDSIDQIDAFTKSMWTKM